MRFLGAGSLVLLVALALVPERRPEPRPVAVWCADRGRGRVVGLDERFVPVTEQCGIEPLRLFGASAEAVWCLARAPEGRERLFRIRATGEREALGLFEDVRDAALLARDEVLLVVADALLGVSTRGDTRALLRMRDVAHVARRADDVLVSTRDGRFALVSLVPELRLRAQGRVEPGVADLAQDKEGWWILSGGAEAPVLTRLSRAGVVRWSRSLEASAELLAAGEEGAWLGSHTGATLWAYDRAGGFQGRIDLPPALAGPRCLRTRQGGLLLACAGLVAALAPDGRAVGSQGGFVDLVGLEPVRKASPDSS